MINVYVCIADYYFRLRLKRTEVTKLKSTGNWEVELHSNLPKIISIRFDLPDSIRLHMVTTREVGQGSLAGAVYSELPRKMWVPHCPVPINDDANCR